MKHFGILLALLLAVTLSHTQAIAKKRDVLHFSHTYKGITTGKSTEKDVQRIFGQPLKKRFKGKNYVYDNMVISLSGKTHKKVNTIQLVNHNTYRDKNGVRLGDTVNSVKQKANIVSNGQTLIDNDKGIIYWHKGNRITKIVLASSFYKAKRAHTTQRTSNTLSPLELERKQKKIVFRLYQATYGSLNVCPDDKKMHFKQVLTDFESRTGKLMHLIRSSQYWSYAKRRDNQQINQLSHKERNERCKVAETYYLKAVDKKVVNEYITILLK